MSADEVPPIIYCPTCQMDTIPLRHGICGFCDTRLIPSDREPEHGTETEYRRGCRCTPCRDVAAAARKRRRGVPVKPAWLVAREARLLEDAEAETEVFPTVHDMLVERYATAKLKNH